MINNWQNYFTVEATLRNCGERIVLHRTGIGLDAIEYAMDKVSHDDRVFDRIEVREKWGAEPLRVVWLSSRIIRNISERINKECVA